MKKILALVACLSLVASLAIGGSIAYLTDRDSEANVFTIGNVMIDLIEKYESNSKLTPNVDIVKEAKIKNIGDNDAYVWMTIAIPSMLDVVGEGDKNSGENVIHWNVPGAFWKGYNKTQKYIDSAIAAGYLSAGSTGVADDETWDVNSAVAVKEETINGIKHNVYTLLYNKAIAKDKETNIGISTVALDKRVDIDTDGNMYFIVNGEKSDLKWNVKTQGNPVIYVSAYAIQADGFKEPIEAYNAYVGQWGDKGTEYGISGTSVSNTADATTALEQDQATVTLSSDIDATESIMMKKGGTFNGAGNTITKTSYAGTGNNAVVETAGGMIENLTVVDETAGASKGLRAVYMTGGMKEDLVIKNCVLDGTYAINVNQSNSEYKLIVNNSTLNGWTSYGTIGGAEFNNVTFGKGTAGYEYMRAYANTEINGCTFGEGFKMGVGKDSTTKIPHTITITIKNSTYGSEKLTAQNFKDKLVKEEDLASYVNTTVVVDGVTVTNLK